MTLHFILNLSAIDLGPHHHLMGKLMNNSCLFFVGDGCEQNLEVVGIEM